MAILHKATVTPTKVDLIIDWLDRQPWGGEGDVERLGSYRFDDPDGEVGVEGLLVRRGDRVLHVALTYRGAPMPDGDDHLVGTVQHSVLGERWVYEAAGDPVAMGCYLRALRGEQQQAELELWDGDRRVDRPQPTVRLHREQDLAVIGDRPRLTTMIGEETGGAQRLVAEWPEGRGVVAAVGG